MDLTPKQQLAIIDRQIQEWKETVYSVELNAQVHTRIGTPPAQIAPLVERATQAHKAITELQKIREAVTREVEGQ